jgi:hypothetical protein
VGQHAGTAPTADRAADLTPVRGDEEIGEPREMDELPAAAAGYGERGPAVRKSDPPDRAWSVASEWMFAGLQHQIGRGARGLGDSW